MTEPVLYLEPEIEQDEGHDVTVRAFTPDMKSCISFTILDTRVLVTRSGLLKAKATVAERFTHSAFVRLDREGWMDHGDFLSLLDLHKAGDLELVDNHRHSPRSEPKALGEILTMASAAYHASALLDRAVATLQRLADTGDETARDFLDKNKEALDGR